jgi:hypothetical protein
MADNNDSNGKGRIKSSPASRLQPAPHKQVFDRWLEGRLHQMFDSVVGEELPPDLLTLLERMRAQNAAIACDVEADDGNGTAAASKADPKTAHDKK